MLQGNQTKLLNRLKDSVDGQGHLTNRGGLTWPLSEPPWRVTFPSTCLSTGFLKCQRILLTKETHLKMSLWEPQRGNYLPSHIPVATIDLSCPLTHYHLGSLWPKAWVPTLAKWILGFVPRQGQLTICVWAHDLGLISIMPSPTGLGSCTLCGHVSPSMKPSNTWALGEQKKSEETKAELHIYF